MVALVPTDDKVCHRTYEEKLRATTLSVINTLDELTAPLQESNKYVNNDGQFSSVDNDGDSNMKQPFSSVSYHERLTSFRTSTYFAKPVELSPIVCARFGWMNLKQDILRCPDCGKILCIDISNKLSEISRQSLIQSYRKMLATWHADCCPFRNVSEKWLLTKGKMKDTLYNDCTVPPYLLSLSNEFHLFEHANKNSLVLMDSLSKVAVDLSKALNKKLKGKNLPSNDIPLPEKVTSLIATKFQDDNDFISVLIKAFQRTIAMNTNEKQENPNQLTNDSALLSCFGWRLLGNSWENPNCKGVPVSCKFCQSSAILTLDDPDEKNIKERSTIEIESEKQNDVVPLHVNHSNEKYVGNQLNNSGVTKSSDICDFQDSPMEITQKEIDASHSKDELEVNDEVTIQIHKRKRIYAVKYHYDNMTTEFGRKEILTNATMKDKGKYYKRPSPCKKRRKMDPMEEKTFLSSDFVLPEKPEKISLSTDFDLINSHKHYCPYYCGFPKEIDLTNNSLDCRPGWEILLTNILDFLKESSTEQRTSKNKKLHFRFLSQSSK